MPALSSKDAAIEAAEKLTLALKNPHPASILAPLKIEQMKALEKLTEIFDCAVDFDGNSESRVSKRNAEGTTNKKTSDKSVDDNGGRPRVKRTSRLGKLTPHIPITMVQPHTSPLTRARTISQNQAQNRLLGTSKFVETSRCGTGGLRLAGAPHGGVGLLPVFEEGRGSLSRTQSTATPPPDRSDAMRCDANVQSHQWRTYEGDPDDCPPPPVRQLVPVSTPDTTLPSTATWIPYNHDELPRSTMRDEQPKRSLQTATCHPHISTGSTIIDSEDEDVEFHDEIQNTQLAPTPLPHYSPSRTSHRYPLRSLQHLANNICESNVVSESETCNAVMETATGDTLHYRDLIKGPNAHIWLTSCANDFGRLAQGVGTRMPTGTNTIFFIPKSKVPNDRKVSYINPVASIRPNKAEVYRVRLTAGGNRLEYPGVTAIDTVSLTTTKVHLNSVISTKNAKYMTIDIKDYYYGTPLSTYEYLRVHLKFIPEEIIRQYNLKNIAHEEYVYIEVQKGMSGLKQAGKIANDRLTSHLAKFGYVPTERTPALWVSKNSNLTFTLCVDDFGIKYTAKKDVEHLINALRSLYKFSIDWTGRKYIGLTLDWDYNRRILKI